MVLRPKDPKTDTAAKALQCQLCGIIDTQVGPTVIGGQTFMVCADAQLCYYRAARNMQLGIKP